MDTICRDLADNLTEIYTGNPNIRHFFHLYKNPENSGELKVHSKFIANMPSLTPISCETAKNLTLADVTHPDTATLLINLNSAPCEFSKRKFLKKQNKPESEALLSDYKFSFAEPVANWLKTEHVQDFYVSGYLTESANSNAQKNFLLRVSINKNDIHAMITLGALAQGISNAQKTLLSEQKGRA